MVNRPRYWFRGWSLWSTPATLRRYVVAVVALAVVASCATAFLVPVGRDDLVRFAVLAACAAVSIELTRRIERQREYLRHHAVAYVDTKGIWSTAAVLVLPPVLATAMVVLTYVLAWARIWPDRRPMPHRWVFGCATVLLGTQAAVAVLSVGIDPYPGLPEAHTLPGVVDLVVIVLACAVRWLLNCGLVMGVLALSSPDRPVKDLFTGFSQQMLEAGSMGLGLVAATVLVANPVVLGAVVLTVVVMHRGVLLHQYQTESRTDAKTGLSSVKWWRLVAERAFEAARRDSRGVGVLILDIDRFKQVNDTHGHLVGDRVLTAVSRELADEVRRQDTCCRWGGEELTVVLPDVDDADALVDIAERIRRRIGRLTVETASPASPTPSDSSAAGSAAAGERVGVTVSIGAALAPAGGGLTLDEALMAADRAVYLAKEDGRNRVRLANTREDSAAPAR
nr:GGDEF domain-containing protein [Saccharomonospora saliphila]